MAVESTSSKTLLTVMGVVLPAVLAIGFGYGAAKFTAGALEQRVTNIENRMTVIEKLVDQNRVRLEDTRDKQISREEIRAYVESLKESIEQVRNDVRSLRR